MIAIPILLALCITFISLYNLSLGVTLSVVAKILIPNAARITIGPIDIALHIVLAGILMTILLFKVYKKELGKTMLINGTNNLYLNKFIKYPFIYILVLVFLIIPNTFSTAIGIQISTLTRFILSDFALGVVAFYAITNEFQYRRFLKILLVSVSVACIYGIYSYLIQANPYINLWYSVFPPIADYTDAIETMRGILTGRVQGTLDASIGWGQLMEVLFAFLLLAKDRISQKIIWPVALLIFTASFLSGTRSVIIALFIMFLFFVLSLSLKMKRKIVLITVLGVILLSANVIRINKNFGKFIAASVFFWDESKSNEANIGGSSVSLRKKQLEYSFYMVDDNILTGLGQGWIVENNRKYGQHPVMLGYESIIFKRLVETGLIGLITFFWLYYRMYLFIRRKFIKIYPQRDLFLLQGFFLSYLVSILFTDAYGTFYMFFVLCIVYLKSLYFNDFFNNNTFIQQS